MSEKVFGLTIRLYDFSETSRIGVFWTREHGKMRGLARGAKRLKSSFESSLDLLNACSIVLIRKASGLDLLTEAQVRERFPALRLNLSALYGGYYLAELLSDLTQDHDPHPPLFDEALQALRDLGQPGVATGPRLAQFELVLLRELGYGPALDSCAACGSDIGDDALAYSAAAGGIVCRPCQNTFRERRPLSVEGWQAMRKMRHGGDGWKGLDDPATRREVRQMLDDSVSYLLGRRPKLLPYLGS